MFSGTVKERIQITESLVILRIACDVPDFVPGQFMMLKRKGDSQSMARAFSIVSIPSEKRFLEFFIKKKKNGTASPLFFSLDKEDEVELSGPFGKFLLNPGESKKLYFIGAGSGIAPLLSMVRQLIHSGWRGEINFFQGASYADELAFKDELETLSRTQKGAYSCSVSRPASGWKGLKGRITDFLEGRVFPGGAQAYVCGPPGMVEDAIKKLKAMGFSDAELFFEKYA